MQCTVVMQPLLVACCVCLGMALPWLQVRGPNVVNNATGEVVVLRGLSLGATFLIEPWMTAIHDLYLLHPSTPDEASIWRALEKRFSANETAALKLRWRSNMIAPDDIALMASLGLNVVRIPFFYQMLQADSNPTVLIEEGMKVLENILDACAKYGVYAILDMHGAPGAQSLLFTTGQSWVNQLFKSAAWQQQTVQLWELIAKRVQHRPEVAGFDLLNEPMGAPNASALFTLYDRLYIAIRAVDTAHILWMEDGYFGAKYFPKPSSHGWQNVAYSLHVYSLLDSTNSSALKWISATLPSLATLMCDLSAPMWIGEFNPSPEPPALSLSTFSAYTTAFNRCLKFRDVVRHFRAPEQLMSTLHSVGFSWSAWSFKRINSGGCGNTSLWGAYTNACSGFPRTNLYTDSFDQIASAFDAYRTTRLVPQRDYLSLIQAAASAPFVPSCQRSILDRLDLTETRI
jgi:endoglucanase